MEYEKKLDNAQDLYRDMELTSAFDFAEILQKREAEFFSLQTQRSRT